MDEGRLHGGLMGMTETSMELLDWVDLINFEGKSDCEYFLDLNILLIELILRLYSMVSWIKLLGAMVKSWGISELQVGYTQSFIRFKMWNIWSLRDLNP